MEAVRGSPRAVPQKEIRRRKSARLPAGGRERLFPRASQHVETVSIQLVASPGAMMPEWYIMN